MRYRFQSWEIVSGAFINDAYLVRLRTSAGGEVVEDVENYASGASRWFELSERL